MSKFSIRQAAPEDAEQIIKVKNNSWLTAHVNEKFGVTKELLEQRFSEEDRFKKNVAKQQKYLSNQNRAKTYVICEREKIVGAGTFDQDKNSISMLYLLKDYQSQGLGSRLMEVLLEEIDDKRTSQVEVAEYNQKARKFYEKFGFKTVRQKSVEESYFLTDSIFIPLLVMERPPSKLPKY